MQVIQESQSAPSPVCRYRLFIDAENAFIGGDHLEEARTTGETPLRLSMKELRPRTTHGPHLCAYFLWVYQDYLSRVRVDRDDEIIPFFIGHNNPTMKLRTKRLCIANEKRASSLLYIRERTSWRPT